MTETNKIFKMMGFDNTEDLSRAPKVHKEAQAVAPRQERRVDRREMCQMSDRAYARATMAGPF